MADRRTNLASKRWEAETRRALERGLLTTSQAAGRMGVPSHMIKHWKTLGLIHDFGGGKGHPSLFDPKELESAPSRRVNLRLGWRGRPVTEAERMADRRLAKGLPISLPLDSPYRMLAWSCRKCGNLVTCKDPRRSAPRAYWPHECYMERAREYGRRPPRVARNHAHAQRANAATLDVAARSGYQWTGPELEIVARDDLRDREKAVMLRRTLFAVRTQRQRLKDDPRKIRLVGLSLSESI